MEKERGHCFVEDICNKYGFFYDSRISKFNCKDLLKIRLSHKWISIYWNFKCEICNIDGRKDLELIDNQMVRPYYDELYTCNEYLMIKANE